MDSSRVPSGRIFSVAPGRLWLTAIGQHALRWYLWLPLSRWLELGRRHPLPRGAQTAARRRAAAQYEAAAPQIAARFRRLLASLDRLLREEVR